MNKFFVLCVFVFAVSLSAGAAPNLIQNGSFESPGFTNEYGQLMIEVNSTQITSWTIIGGNVALHKSPDINIPTFSPAQDGSIYLDLSGYGPPHGNIYQDIPTSPGTEYLLTFYIGASNGNVPAQTIVAVIEGAKVCLDTSLTPLAPNGNDIDWLEEIFSFTADSISTRILFSDNSRSNDNASFIDNVSVVAVPEPTSLLPLSLLTLALLRRR